MSNAAVPQGNFVDIGDGMQIHYHEAGEGHPVIFIHGSGPGASGWSNFRRNYPVLADAGFRTIIPDSIGYGHSSKPDDAKYTLDFMVDGLQKLADRLEIQTCSLVGNSLGGAMAIRWALREPDRIQKLVLMAPGGLEERETYMEMRGIKTMVRAFFHPDGLTHESMRKVFELQLYNPSQITDEIIEERLQIALTQPKCVISTMKVPNQTEDLAKLNCPILGFWGMNDQFCPATGATKIATCKNARMVLLSECGHWVMVEKTDLFNRYVVDFLQE